MKRATRAAGGVCTIIAALACWSRAGADVTPTRLTCEHAVNPLGIDAPHPCLGWLLESSERDQRQTIFQIRAASAPSLLPDHADLWDSGRIQSAESVQVPYGGPALATAQRVYWCVRAWDRDGKPSEWSAPAWWEMGVMSPRDWKARWIGNNTPLPVRDEDFYNEEPAPLLRTEFTLEKKVRRARAYVSGLGYYELRINGEKVGDHVLDPGWTDYSKQVLYSTFDVTGLVTDGPNAVGIMPGNGWYNPLPIWGWGSPERNLRKHLTIGRPRALMQLEIEFDDGTRRSVVTDHSWKAAGGPIVRNSVYLGEEYDARAEHPGWDRPGFDDSKWAPVALASEPVGPLRAQAAPPIRVIERLRPVAVTEPKPGVFIVDMGRNFAGVAQLRVRGPRGTRVTMRCGEILFPDGTLNGRTSAAMQVKAGGAVGGPGCPVEGWQTDAYTLRGGTPDGAPEIFTPRFTFHGFRYVELTGFPGAPTLDTLEGLVLCSDVRTVGEFECSSDLFNQIHQMCVRTFRSNLFSVQSDCPHREKFGYGGDLAATGEAFMLNFDMSLFYRKSVRDLADAARPNGGLTETAPYVGIADEGLGDGAGPVGWGSAHPLLCSQLVRNYNDRALMAEQFPAVQRWVRLLESKAVDGILDNGIGDHESLAPKSPAVTGTAFYYLNATLAAEMAAALKRPDDRRRYTELAGSIRSAMRRRFFDPGTGRVDSGAQCNQAAFLALGVLENAERDKALGVLVGDITDAHAGHLTTGIFGTRWMLMALSDLGRADVAYEVVGRESFPGWGHMLKSGATTLWETWAPSDNIYSHNHPMFGSVDEWFYKVVAGIRPAPDAAGFDRVVIQPRIGGGVTWARGAYESVRGRVESEWRLDADRLTIRVSIPCGVSAAVCVPASDQVMEGDVHAEIAAGVQFVGRADGVGVYSVGSGDYTFRCTYAPIRPEDANQP